MRRGRRGTGPRVGGRPFAHETGRHAHVRRCRPAGAQGHPRPGRRRGGGVGADHTGSDGAVAGASRWVGDRRSVRVFRSGARALSAGGRPEASPGCVAVPGGVRGRRARDRQDSVRGCGRQIGTPRRCDRALRPCGRRRRHLLSAVDRGAGGVGARQRPRPRRRAATCPPGAWRASCRRSASTTIGSPIRNRNGCWYGPVRRSCWLLARSVAQ